ncbi:MAG: response regulator [Alphaproteobacteria bacterium]|nr:MAG: response regulator [Alphaproteobacteria bacterium]
MLTGSAGFRPQRLFLSAVLVLYPILVTSIWFMADTLAERQIITQVERENLTITHVVRRALWSEFDRVNESDMVLARVRVLVSGTAIVKVKIFDTAGVTVFSTLASEIGVSAADRVEVRQALAGNAVSALGFRPEFQAIEGTRRDLWVVYTYAPIDPAQGQSPFGVFEVYADATAAVQAARDNAHLIATTMALGVAVLLACLWLIIRRSEQIIDRQVAQLQAGLSETRSQAEALDEMRILLEDALTSIPVGVVVFDKEDRLVMWNQPYAELVAEDAPMLRPGVPYAEILRAGLRSGWIVSASADEEAYVRNALDHRQRFQEPYDRAFRNGRSVRVVERPTRTGGVVGYRLDITDLKARESQLAEARTLLEDAIAAMPVGVMLFDSEDRIQLWNQPMLDYLGDHAALMRAGITYREFIADTIRAGVFTDLPATEAELDALLDRVVQRHQACAAPWESASFVSGRKLLVAEQRTRSGGIVGVRLDISDRIQREQELARTRQLLEDAIEAMPTGVILFDREDRIVLWNKRYLDMLRHHGDILETGITYRELVSRALDRNLFVDVGDTPEARAAWLDQTVARHQACSEPLETLRFDGTVAIRSEDRRTRDGGIVGTRLDLSDIRRRERELQETRQLLEDALEAMPAGVVLFDPEDRIVLWNSRYTEMLGRDADTLRVGATFRDFLASGLARGAFREAGTTREEQEAWLDSTVARHLACDGPREVDRLNDSLTLRIEERRTRNGGIVGVRLDITDVRRREREAREMRQLLEDALGAMPCSVVLTDADDRLLYWNAHFASQFRPHTDILQVGKTYEAILWDSLRHGLQGVPDHLWADWVANVQRRRLVTAGQAEFLLSDGRWFLAMEQRTRNHGIVGVRVEITDHKEREAALEQARAEAEAANRAKSAFLANISHEIRTPMNGIMGMNTLLLDTTLDEEQRHFAEAVRISAEGLLTVIDDILDVAKLEAGRIDLVPEDTDVSEIIAGVVDLLAPKAGTQGIAIGDMVDPSLRRRLRIDPVRLRQVLLNLAGNAVKFTHSGWVSIEARPTERPIWAREDTSPDAHWVRFDVVDTGIGISATVLPRLFTKFEQADSSVTRRYGGTGLGLAISRELVELMGGRITVESQPDVGSRFWFVLPLMPAETEEEDAPDISALSGRRVLVVDDREINRTIVLRTLASLAVLAEAAETGQDALDRLIEAAEGGSPFDCVLLDMQMPGQSGPEVASAIRADPRLTGLKVVFLSSAGLPSAAQMDLADAVMVKPIRAVALAERLASLLGQHIRLARAEQLVQAPISTSGPSARVMVVEDDPINRQIAVAFLTAAGHSVIAAGSGEMALEIAAAEAIPDLVLMDVQMPGLDGIETTKRLRSRGGAWTRVPVIAMTAHAMAGTRERLLEAGMTDYLPKPVARPQLLEALNQHLALAAAPEVDPRLDLGVLGMLRETLGAAAFSALVQTFRTDLTRRLGQIAKDAAAFDWVAVDQTAHDIAGSSGSMGAVACEAAARGLMAAARARDGDGVTTARDALVHAARATDRAFEALMTGRG